MGTVLTKSYKRWEPGTVLTSDQDEFLRQPTPHRSFEEGGGPSDAFPKTVYVNAERMAQLEREGYFTLDGEREQKGDGHGRTEAKPSPE